MKNFSILGSTGSIGKQTLEVVSQNPDKFKVIALSTHKNIELLISQIKQFKPKFIGVVDLEAAQKIRDIIPEKISLVVGLQGLVELSSLKENDVVVNALVGSIGLDATIAALESGKVLALANKESLVVGGEIIIKVARAKNAQIIPIDSEHNAIFQCLIGERKEDISRLIITGSGGPFRGKKNNELKKVTVEEALVHPRWRMGKKISIDSATLMNKGLEVIEAHFLFGIDYDKIEVLIHPQSIIHSMIEFKDGSIKAHLGQTDMRIPIQYALSYPERLPSPLPPLDFIEIANLTFEKPDLETFPCLKYALQAGKEGKTYPAVLNASNEEAVAALLNNQINFTDISKIVEKTLNAHTPLEVKNIVTLKEAGNWARNKAKEIIKTISKN